MVIYFSSVIYLFTDRIFFSLNVGKLLKHGCSKTVMTAGQHSADVWLYLSQETRYLFVTQDPYLHQEGYSVHGANPKAV